MTCSNKQEIIDVQTKYLQAMKDAQKSFETYKLKKDEEARKYILILLI